MVQLEDLPMAETRFVKPMLLSPGDKLPVGNEWSYEVKFDGFRALVERHANGVRIWSKEGNSFTEQYPQIVEGSKALTLDTLIDGELVALDDRGKISFNLLKNYRIKAKEVLFYAFDMPIYKGRDLMHQPLHERRRFLAEIMEHANRPILWSAPFQVPPDQIIKSAKDLGFEGVVAKLNNSIYEPGRRTDKWQKYKFHHERMFVISGYTLGNPFESLVLGYYENERLAYAGEVSNGFLPFIRKQVLQELKETEACPFSYFPENSTGVYRWTVPEKVAKISFVEWNGKLLSPSFLGLRKYMNPRMIRK